MEVDYLRDIPSTNVPIQRSVEDRTLDRDEPTKQSTQFARYRRGYPGSLETDRVRLARHISFFFTLQFPQRI
jgi:hypothetical protein